MTLPIHIPQVWTKQPPAGTPIDWSNPLTEGLVFAAPTADQRDAVTGNLPVTIRAGNQTRPVDFGKYGSGLASSGGGTTISNVGRFYSDAYAHAMCSNRPGFAMWGLHRTGSTRDSWETPWGVDEDSDNANPYFVGYSASSGNSGMYYNVTAADGTGQRTNVGSGWPGVDTVFTMCMSFNRDGYPEWTNDRLVLWKDGQRVGSTAGLDQNVLPWASETNSNTICLNDWDQAQNQDNFSGDVLLALMWNRALSPAEVAELEKNPWQIFKPLGIYVPEPVKRRVVTF